MKHSHLSILAANTVLVTFLLASTSFAASHPPVINLKGEVPCQAPLILDQGLYIGANVGYDAYRVTDDINYLTAVPTAPFAPVYMKSKLGVNGVVGGGFLGYGKYFDNFYNTYLGVEVFGNWSSAELNYSQSASTSVPSVTPAGTYLITEGLETNLKAKYNVGISILPGIKVSDIALVYVRLGYNWAHFDVNQNVTNSADFLDTFGTVVPSGSEILSSTTSNTSHGFNYGIGLEAALITDMSTRLEYTHTSYSSFSMKLAGNTIRPSDNQFMLGVIYHPRWI